MGWMPTAKYECFLLLIALCTQIRDLLSIQTRYMWLNDNRQRPYIWDKGLEHVNGPRLVNKGET